MITENKQEDMEKTEYIYVIIVHIASESDEYFQQGRLETKKQNHLIRIIFFEMALVINWFLNVTTCNYIKSFVIQYQIPFFEQHKQ